MIYINDCFDIEEKSDTENWFCILESQGDHAYSRWPVGIYTSLMDDYPMKLMPRWWTF